MRAVRTGSFRTARGVWWRNAPKGQFAAAVVRLLQSPAAFGIGGAPGGYPPSASYGCGCSSGVEHDLAKVGVEGSNPFARSKIRLVKVLFCKKAAGLAWWLFCFG